MARFSISYNGLEERKLKIQEQEILGNTMISDDFDKSWKLGNEPFGEMIFTDNKGIDTPIPRPIAIDFRDLYSRAPNDSEKLDIIAQKLRLK